MSRSRNVQVAIRPGRETSRWRSVQVANRSGSEASKVVAKRPGRERTGKVAKRPVTCECGIYNKLSCQRRFWLKLCLVTHAK